VWEFAYLKPFVDYGFPIATVAGYTPVRSAVQAAAGYFLPTAAPTRQFVYAVAGVTSDGVESIAVESGIITVGADISPTTPVYIEITAGDPVDHYVIYKGFDGVLGFIGTVKCDITGQQDAAHVRQEALTYWISFYQNAGGYDYYTVIRLANDEADKAAQQAASDAGIVKGETSFIFPDDNIAPDFTDRPRERVNEFVPVVLTTPLPDGTSIVASKPACVAYFQQRRIYANLDKKPDTLIMSETGDYGNFQRSIPTIDSDSMEVTLAQGALNEIRALVPLRNLLVFTAGGEFVLSGGDRPVTPSNIDASSVSYRGIGSLQPLVIGGVVLFKDRGGHIRELLYDVNSNDYPSSDVGLLASHLFDGHRIVDWEYVSSPRSVVWAIRSDGSMLSFTYVREQSVAAWARHTTEGKFRSMCSIRQGAAEGETLYFVVDRTINGVATSFIERMAPRDPKTSPCLDCSSNSVTYSGGAGTMEVSLTPAAGIIATDQVPRTMGWLKGNWIHLTANGVQFQDGQDALGSQVWLYGPSGERIVTKYVRNDGVGPTATIWVELVRDMPAAYRSNGYVFSTWKSASTTVGFFNHLKGHTVTVLADDGVISNQVVVNASDGSVALAQPASKVLCGLPYQPTLVMLPLNSQQQDIRSKPINISDVYFEVQDTRGMWVGEEGGTLTEVKPQFPDNQQLQTGRLHVRISSRWGASRCVTIVQKDPIPCTILSVTPEVTLGG
jgi:hypothetical protein